MSDLIIILLIYIVVPIIGIAAYVSVVKKIFREQISPNPAFHLFWVFGIYGVLLIIILTELFWKISGMISLGTFAAITVGPVILGYVAVSNYKLRKLTIYHVFTFWLSIVYVIGMILLIASSILFNLY